MRPSPIFRTNDEVPQDPWNNEYGDRYPGSRKSDFFELVSRGPDGLAETDDDVSRQE